MSLEWFSRLKEYDSLTRGRLGHLNSIKDQEKRLDTLKDRKNENLSQLSNLKSIYVRQQQELHELEQKIKVQSEQKQRWIDQGGDDLKKKNMESELSKMEDQGFALLQDLETNEIERKDVQTFLQGLEKTIAEIFDEVNAEKLKHESEIKQIDLRLEGILELLPEEFKDLLMRVLKKNLAHGPFTRIESGHCFFCRYQISRVDESEIDMQRKLKTCPQCNRIFIPYGT